MKSFHFVNWWFRIKREVHIGDRMVHVQGCFIKHIGGIQGRARERMARMRRPSGASRSRQGLTGIRASRATTEIEWFESILHATKLANVQFSSGLNVASGKSVRGRASRRVRGRSLVVMTKLCRRTFIEISKSNIGTCRGK